MKPRDDLGGQATGGFALIAVLAFLLVVSAIVVPFALTARTQLMIANNEKEQDKLSILADGLVNVIGAELSADAAPEPMSMAFGEERCEAGPYSLSLRIQDHQGLIDLNASDEQLIAQGFASLGFDPAAADQLAHEVIQFRSPQSSFAVSERPDDSLVAKHAPFESVAELQDFAPLADMKLANLFGVFTVNSKRSTINIERAPEGLRKQLKVGHIDTANSDETTARSMFTLVVSARLRSSAIVGFAGYMMERQPDGSLLRIGGYPVSPLEQDNQAPTSSEACTPIFGAGIQQLLDEMSS